MLLLRVQSIKSLLRASYSPVRRCDQLISSRKSITLMFIISSRDGKILVTDVSVGVDVGAHPDGH